jgi:hypothetical protein
VKTGLLYRKSNVDVVDKEGLPTQFELTVICFFFLSLTHVAMRLGHVISNCFIKRIKQKDNFSYDQIFIIRECEFYLFIWKNINMMWQ